MTILVGANDLPIDPLWAAEFRGYFFGDGYLAIAKNGSKRSGLVSYSPLAQITTRDDDSMMLEDIKQKLGGSTHSEFPTNQRSRPVRVWRVRSQIGVSLVCDLLEGAVLPSKKLREVKLVRKFFNLKIPPGPRPGGFDLDGIMREREKICTQIKELHAYTFSYDEESNHE